MIWKNDAQFLYTNNWNGVVQYYIYQNWDNFNMQWVNSRKYTYAYFPYELGLTDLMQQPKHVIKVYDLMGQETKDQPNTPLIYLYSDGSTEKVYRVE